MVDVNETENPESMRKIFKILVVGEMGTGKTSLLRKYVDGVFSEYYKTTIGVDFASKDIKWDDKTNVSLQLWDIAGQERFGSMTHVYYQEAVGALLVFDVMRHQTLELAIQWKKDIDSKVFTSQDKPIPCLLLGNKIDLAEDGKWGKTEEEMKAFCDEHGFIGFFETSARTGHNLEEAPRALVKYIIENNIEPFSEGHGVDLNSSKEKKEGGGCC
ncbi:Ras family protein [Trichomonas vaginalis G3]|uniref:Ras-related protein Rab n=1 Tax=Trichomonas vaginalis (strain ATCC PRA-98 / G3) TaxID=412133 RepID=A2D8H9_TRIV3|nr:BLOC-2 complex binding [Trichomonas vaginalis G3]EAY23228.1 Ras family protein [Trichomonas vaginalis G3]KAI5534123.1 BLOC-2 complex binding [Trichomonas vaginalis G3]|eukprot:XP_001584214.1 Ras family protein [Trichomonas vaginalis G3]